jgi:hypothetical protein
VQLMICLDKDFFAVHFQFKLQWPLLDGIACAFATSPGCANIQDLPLIKNLESSTQSVSFHNGM